MRDTAHKIDAETVREAARSQWDSLLPALGVSAEYLRDRHGPCPGCDGEDRFRYDNPERGGFICGRGGDDPLAGDGFTLLEHVHGWSFSEALAAVAGELGLGYEVEPPTPAELEQRRQEQAERRRKEEEREQRKRAEAANKAGELWRAASPATRANPYLDRKGVQPVSTLREVKAETARQTLGYAPKADGEPLEGLLLVAPVKVAGELSTVELIDGSGRKSAVLDGVKGSGWWATGSLEDSPSILVGEGVATVLSATEASGLPGVAGLASNNLPKVAEALRAQYPAATLVILADLAKSTQEPDPGAVKAARKAEALLAVPDFGGERPEGAKDFNDLAQIHGLEAVNKALESAAPITQGTGVTGVTTLNDGDLDGSPEMEGEVTQVTADGLPEPEIQRPGFQTHDSWFSLKGTPMRPGLYWHGWTKNDEPVDNWICSPIHAVAQTEGEEGDAHGLLLRFLTPRGRWREWAAPLHLLKGSGEELRGELLDLGVRIDPKNRNLLTHWLMAQYPENWIVAATRCGWHEGGEGRAFVMPGRTLGSQDVRFQSEHAIHDAYAQRGALEGWREQVAALCSGNPLLVLSVSAAFAGPLLRIAKLQEVGGAGLHFFGDSSRGKSTLLQTGASVWGGPGFIRTWRATANGMEGTAASLSDALLVLDEISECDPREIGSIVYALANGTGKQRGNKTGGARHTNRWRILALSSGERTLAAHMQEGGRRVKAGQEARLLDIPSTDRRHGAFDCLHGHEEGRAFAELLKQATGAQYGHAGPAFVEALLNDERDLPGLYGRTCALPALSSADGIEGRAAGVFGLVGLAGELASEYGITGWAEGEAMEAAIGAYQLWRHYRGGGHTENHQILTGIREFLARHGDSRFSPLDNPGEVRDRAGYFEEKAEGTIWLFNSPGLREAAPGFDIRRILDALEDAGWIAEKDKEKRSKRKKIQGEPVPFYAIRPCAEEDE